MSFVVLLARHGSTKFAALTNYGGRIVCTNFRTVLESNRVDKRVISKEQTKNRTLQPYKRLMNTMQDLSMSVMCKPVKRKTSFCAFYISGIITTLVLLQIMLTSNNSCALNAEWAVRSQMFNLLTNNKHTNDLSSENLPSERSSQSFVKGEFHRKEYAKEVKEEIHEYVTDDKWRQFVHHHTYVESSPFADVHIPSLALPALHKYTEETELCTSYVSPLRRWECLPAIAFLLHCITRLLECCFVHKFRCGLECVDNHDNAKGKKHVDSVTLFATLAGCSFYVFASLSTSFVLLPLIREAEVMSSMRNQLYYTPQNRYTLIPESNVITTNYSDTATTRNVDNVTAGIHDNTINVINNKNNTNNISNKYSSNNNLFAYTIDDRHYASAHKIAYFSSWLDAARSPSTRDVYRVNTNTTIITADNTNNDVSKQNTIQVKFTLAHSEHTDTVNSFKEMNDVIALREPWHTLRFVLTLLPEWFIAIIIVALFVLHIFLQILQVMHHSVLASLRSSRGHHHQQQQHEYDRRDNLKVLKWAERKLQYHTKAAIAVRAHEDQNDARWMRKRRTALESSSCCNEKGIKSSSRLSVESVINSNNKKLNNVDCERKEKSDNSDTDINNYRKEQMPNISSFSSSSLSPCVGVDKRIFSYHFPSTRLLFQYVLEPHYTLEVLMYCTNACMMCIFTFFGICFAPAAIEQTKFNSLLPAVFVTSSAHNIFNEYAMSWKYMTAITLQLFPAFAVALFSFCNLAITAEVHRAFWQYVNEERDVSRVLLSTDLQEYPRIENVEDWSCTNKSNHAEQKEYTSKAQIAYQRSIMSVFEKEDIPDWNLIPGIC